MTWSELHPALNAVLNATSAVLIITGGVLIKRDRAGNRDRHRRLMSAATVVSAVFLLSYVIRFATTGTHRYPGAGADKVFYLVILFSHMVLAVVLLPLVVRALQHARAGRLPEHRRVVRWAWPVWMYVSVTGVVVYLMLYQVGPRL
ncbi:MAG: DUF420 domain-containing protein [Kofleriaceae bacterium]|jgi:putative membrane protein|nr:DUF420 domain-containing protein [Kofleriaceae bacterium]MBP6841966.1 DUF420 domain-containing protein [Kofleriaceae bacterium]MBP9206675.1 DUF420 domain-containing protein [Kofleriaceae bacterium]